MTDAQLIAAGVAILGLGIIVAIYLINRLERRPYQGEQDDTRPIDILRRGQVIPWPVDHERPAQMLKSYTVPHDAGDSR